MYDSRYKPKLTLNKAINHPIDEFLVIGFMGRDTRYGRDAVVLKGEHVHQKFVRNDEQEEEYCVFAIPERAAKLMREGRCIYVYQDDMVWAGAFSLIEDAETHDFDTNFFDGVVPFETIREDALQTYDGDEVSVE
jgi:hypothetical protein